MFAFRVYKCVGLYIKSYTDSLMNGDNEEETLTAIDDTVTTLPQYNRRSGSGQYLTGQRSKNVISARYLCQNGIYCA